MLFFWVPRTFGVKKNTNSPELWNISRIGGFVIAWLTHIFGGSINANVAPSFEWFAQKTNVQLANVPNEVRPKKADGLRCHSPSCYHWIMVLVMAFISFPSLLHSNSFCMRPLQRQKKIAADRSDIHRFKMSPFWGVAFTWWGSPWTAEALPVEIIWRFRMVGFWLVSKQTRAFFGCPTSFSKYTKRIYPLVLAATGSTIPWFWRRDSRHGLHSSLTERFLF